MGIRARSVVGVVLAAMLGPLAAGFRQGEIGAAADEPPAMTRAPKGYQTRRIEGWQVLDQQRIPRGPARARRPHAPAAGPSSSTRSRASSRRRPCRSCRTIRIWVEENEPHHPCMTYHPDPKWLREHGDEPGEGAVRRAGQRPHLPRLDDRAALDAPARARRTATTTSSSRAGSTTPRSRPPTITR